MCAGQHAGVDGDCGHATATISGQNLPKEPKYYISIATIITEVCTDDRARVPKGYVRSLTTYVQRSVHTHSIRFGLLCRGARLPEPKAILGRGGARVQVDAARLAQKRLRY
jgi:hypothetical protein